MQITRKTPRDYWSPLARLHDHINQVFSTAMDVPDLFEGWNPSIDVEEQGDQLLVRVELPGIKKEDVNVSLERDQLIISGEKKCEETSKDSNKHRSECYYGRFYRSVSLPHDIDPGKVQAQFRDGILTVTLPKSESAKPKRIEISAQ